jgi:hypothetical protein
MELTTPDSRGLPALSVDWKRVSLRRLRAWLRFPASKRGEALEPVSAADQTESIHQLGEFGVLNSFRQDGRHVFEITALKGRQCLRRSQMTVQPISLLGSGDFWLGGSTFRIQ